jgi:hypothetical protein
VKNSNIFNVLTQNEEISDVALCAIHDFFVILLREFETSSFHRIKLSFEELNEACEKPPF